MSGNLTITAENELAIIQAGTDTDEANWAEVLDFWQELAVDVDPDARRIALAMGDFYFNRYWFQVNWRAKGYPLETTDQLGNAVARLKALDLEWQHLSASDYAVIGASLEEEANSLGLRRPLTGPQLKNIASLLRMPRGANFSVPGAGKTATTLVTLSLLFARQEIARALVVCPKSAFEAWILEPEQIFVQSPLVEVYSGQIIDPKTKILVVNFEKAESEKHLKNLKSWLVEQKSGLVIDEAHRVKRGSAGKRWRACMKLSALATRVDLLTGTPMPQSYEDLRNIFSISWKTIPRTKMSDVELAKLKPGGLFVRTTKGELNLPPINYHREPVQMGPLQTEIYRAITRIYAGTLSLTSQDQATLRRKGRAAMTVLAAATNPALIRKDSKEELAKELRWPPKELSQEDGLVDALMSYMSHEMPPKYEWVSRFIAEAHSQNRKTLVWSSFVGNLELLSQVLEPFSPAVIHGKVRAEARDSEIHRFRNDESCAVLLTNPQTLGEGISLHLTTNQAVFVDRTYNAAQYLQALDRIHRLGLPQNIETDVYLLQSNASIDERVEHRLNDKIATLAELLEDQELKKLSLPGDDDSQDLMESLGLNKWDIDDLLGHLAQDK